MGSDRGSISVFAVIVALALLLLAGLVWDGTVKLRAAREATDIAEEAARVGAGRVNRGIAYREGRFVVDTGQALAAARGYLNQTGHHGSVSATGSRAISVRVTISRPTTLLALMGIGSVQATGRATAELVPGIRRPFS